MPQCREGVVARLADQHDLDRLFRQLGIVDQGGEREEIAPELAGKCAEDGFGGIGSPGLLTNKGFAALVRSGEGAFFIAKGYREPADDEQIRKIKAFSEDLQRALFRGTN